MELSITCHEIRNSCFYIIFNTFNFRSFIANENYDSYFNKVDEDGYDDSVFVLKETLNPYKTLTNQFIESKERFNTSLKMFHRYPKQLSIKDCYDYYYLLYDIPNYFKNLISIRVTNSGIQIELLQHLLDSLDYLEKIELSDNWLIQNSPNTTQNAINWPVSLKKLKIYNNTVCYVFNNEDPIRRMRYNRYKLLNRRFIITPQNLPNLLTFKYEDNDTIRHDHFLQFLNLNQQIERLKVYTEEFEFTLFDSIKSLNKLTHLDFNGNLLSLDERPRKDLPVLNTITHLATTLDYISKNRDSIYNMFPNITDLLVNINKDDLELFPLVKKFSNLKNLRLNMCPYYEQPQECLFPKLNNLTTLELIMCYDNLINMINWNADSCPNLKLVKFTSHRDNPPFEQLKLSKQVEDRWNIVNFPYKITFYRSK